MYLTLSQTINLRFDKINYDYQAITQGSDTNLINAANIYYPNSVNIKCWENRNLTCTGEEIAKLITTHERLDEIRRQGIANNKNV